MQVREKCVLVAAGAGATTLVSTPQSFTTGMLAFDACFGFIGAEERALMTAGLATLLLRITVRMATELALTTTSFALCSTLPALVVALFTTARELSSHEIGALQIDRMAAQGIVLSAALFAAAGVVFWIEFMAILLACVPAIQWLVAAALAALKELIGIGSPDVAFTSDLMPTSVIPCDGLFAWTWVGSHVARDNLLVVALRMFDFDLNLARAAFLEAHLGTGVVAFADRVALVADTSTRLTALDVGVV